MTIIMIIASNKFMVSMMIILWKLNTSMSLDSNFRDHMIDRELSNNGRHLVGECQASCSREKQCAPGLKCARYNQDKLKHVGHDPQFAYCDSSSIKNKKNKYVCYDPYKASKKPCPLGVNMSSFGQTCNPDNWSDNSCLVTPLDLSTYCCPSIIDQYNDTYFTCQKYQLCDGYASCNCFDMGTDKPEYGIGCVSSTSCGGYQCIYV